MLASLPPKTDSMSATPAPTGGAVRKVGNRLILESARRKSLLHVLATMAPLAVDDVLPDVDETLTALDEDPFVAADERGE